MRTINSYICTLVLITILVAGSLITTTSIASPSGFDHGTKFTYPGTIENRRDLRGSRFSFVLLNNRLTATVVPELGRVTWLSMAAGKGLGKGTFDWIWTNFHAHPNDSWKNWGGSKTWLAPQSNWLELAGAKWPPDPSWTTVIKTEILPKNVLQTTGALSPHSGIRLIHQYSNDEAGNFVIRQTAEKLFGKPVKMSLWSTTQIMTPKAVFFVLDDGDTMDSAWKTLQGNTDFVYEQRKNIGCYYPHARKFMKFGIKTSTPVLAALYLDQLFVLRATPQYATYPDGIPSVPNGFSLEIRDNSGDHDPTVELDLLSPLRKAWMGSKWTFTVKWNIYALSTSDTKSPQLWYEVSHILNAKP